MTARQLSIALVSCSATKADHACPARELYWPSQLFRAAWGYCAAHVEHTMILSAQHHLVDPEEALEPYSATMQALGPSGRADWAVFVARQLEERLNEQLGGAWPWDWAVSVQLHAGRLYTDQLIPRLLGLSGLLTVHNPLEGLQIGQRLAWYKRRVGAFCPSCKGIDLHPIEECATGQRVCRSCSHRWTLDPRVQ
jgi:hypothetical protein